MAGSSELQESLFIVDEKGLARNAELIGRLGAGHVLVDDLVADDVGERTVIAVDVDVTIIPAVRRLRAALRDLRDGRFKIFAIDTHRRLENIHASIVGATEVVPRPFVLEDLEARLAAFRQHGALRRVLSPTDASIESAASIIGDMFESLISGRPVNMPAVLEASSEIVDAIADTGMPSWVDTVRSHHEGTFQHCLIVTGLSCSFGRATGMSRSDVVTLTTAGMLHDIGKARIPLTILDKPDRLSPAEFEVMKTHSDLGYRYLSQFPDIDSNVLAAVRSHHEYLDGSGYPDGCAAGEIGDLTRILTICDVFGAMIERRSYRPPASPEAALAVLDDMSETGKLETALVRAFHAAA